MAFRNKKEDDRLKCIIKCGRNAQMFCYILLRCGLMESDPGPTDVLCQLDVGVRVSGMASLFKTKIKADDTDEKALSFSHQLTQKLYDRDHCVRGMFPAIDLDIFHWALLFVESSVEKNGNDLRAIKLGDILKTSMPYVPETFSCCCCR